MNSKQSPSKTRTRPSANNTSADAHTSQPNATDSAAEVRRRRTAIAAYFRAEARGFTPGREVEDWLEAERDIEALDGAGERIETPQRVAAADEQVRSATDAPPRKRAASKRSKSTRGAAMQARNRGDES